MAKVAVTALLALLAAMRLPYTAMSASVKSATNFGTTDRLARLRFQVMAGDLAARIGRRIAARRAELSLTQGQLAAQVGTDAVNNQRISDWERGVNRPSDRYMAEIASALDRPVAWFFEDEDAGGTPDLMAVLPKDDVDGPVTVQGSDPHGLDGDSDGVACE